DVCSSDLVLVAAIVLRAYKAVERIVVFISQPFFKLVILGMEPVGKRFANLINLRVRHLYGFHVPHLYFLVAHHYLLGNVRGGINECMFKQGDTIVSAALRFYCILIPYMYILLVTGNGKIIGVFDIMNTYLRIE